MRERKWWIVGLLFAATLLNYVDRQVLSLVNPVLRKELSLTATGYSHVLTSFLFGYTLGQLLVGRVIDRLGARLSLMLAMLWWSASGMLASTSRTSVALGTFLFLMGLGESGGWPASVKAIQQWFSSTERAFAVGVFNSGSSVGAILAPLLISAITLRYSWQAAFLVCGAFGFFWIAPWLVTYPRHVRREAIVSDEEEQNRPPIADLLRNRRLYGVLGGRFFCDSIWYFYIFWLPDFLTRVSGLSLRRVGYLAWIPFVAAALGNLVGGALSGILAKRGGAPENARLKVMAGAALAMSTGIGVWFVHDPLKSIALISFVVFSYSCWASNILTLPSDLFPAGAVATVTGFGGMAAGVGGMLMTLISGWIVDHYSYYAVFVILAVLPLFASGASFLCWRPLRAAVEQQA